jgi:predicted nuclease of restriction endonuclease-like (RecB) superfamily
MDLNKTNDKDSALIPHFQAIQNIIRQGKTKALEAATAFSLASYWSIGSYLSFRLTEKSYGKKVVTELADWLIQQEPTLKGFDRRSLYRMRDFFETWQTVDWSLISKNAINESILIGDEYGLTEQKIVGSINPQLPLFPAIIGKVSWTHHIEILKRVASSDERLFYLILSIKERYTVLELIRQIKSALFERQMLTKHTLLVPEHPKKESFAEIFRNNYLFEFLELSSPYSEFELKKALVTRMKQFLLELGRDFMFLGEELHLKVGMNDYFVDLVFFHRELQCLVAFDLKIDDFKPEHVGKMNFYLELLDRDVKKAHENPSIGVVLCKSKNDEIVEITMSRQLSPTMVAVYETKFIDKELLRQMLHQWTEDWENNQT